MVQITQTAQKYFLKLLSKKKPNTQIRILVINPGTDKAECNISYYSPETVKNTDIQLKFNLMSIYIDPLSQPYLEEAKIDLISDQLGCHLTLQAPNIKKNVSNKTDNNNTPLKNRIKQIIKFQINPQLKHHGGQIKLINITKELLVILEFIGNCNGCSMVPYTLKEGIEKTLKHFCPEITGVKDVTIHQRGSHSFY